MKHLLFLFLGLIPIALSGQNLSAGIMIGGANYMGDLSRNSRAMHFKETGPAAGIFGRYGINDFVSVKLGLNYARISGADDNANDADVNLRNLSFRSDIFELAITGELNISGYQPYGLYNTFSPYLFLGVSVFSFNPKANYLDEWVALQPLGTEGQGLIPGLTPYNRVSFAIPFGIGAKYAVTDKLNVGIEIGARRTFTDYLDDVSGNYVEYSELLAGNGTLAAALGNRSGELGAGEPFSVPTGTQRGDDARKDWFFIMGITASYNFSDTGLMGSRRRVRSKNGCKTN